MSATDPLQPTDGPANEIQELRRSLRDLVALSALPAIWSSQNPSGISDSLADALLSMLRVDLVYVQLQAAKERAPNLAVRIDGHPDLTDRTREISRALAPYLNFDAANSVQ